MSRRQPDLPAAGAVWPGQATVKDFLGRHLAGRRLSARTCLTYGRSLKGFARWLAKGTDWKGDWSVVTARNLRDFVIERQKSHARSLRLVLGIP